MKRQSIRHLRQVGLWVAALACLGSAQGAWACESENEGSLKVERLEFPVTLSDGQSASMVGYLYYHGSFQYRPLQVLVHGATYNHSYWDIPAINGRDYSYVRYMLARNYAVLAIDQLGSGESPKPDGDLVTLQEQASCLHQVLTQLKAGAVGRAFEQIALVGHSFGAATAIYTQAVYGDAGALVSTGLGHVPHTLPISSEFILSVLPYPYFPLAPEMRAFMFYGPVGVDPAVVAWDNSYFTEMISRGQLLTVFFTLFDPAATLVGNVKGPVLVQLGEHDVLFPAALADGEAAYWTSASSVTVQSLPGVGHDFNGHVDHLQGWEQIDAWLSSTFAR